MDLKFALRSLRLNPGFTLLSILVLALGIGANTAIFSVVNAVLLQPLEYKDPGRIVAVGNTWKDRKISMAQMSEPDFDDLHDQSTVFDGLACYLAGGNDTVLVGKSAEYSAVSRVSPEFFHVMGADAAMGRLFSPAEERQEGTMVAAVSDGFWKRRLGGNTNAIGSTVRAYDRIFTVVGVLPPGFGFPGKTEVWIPRSAFDKNEHRSANNFQAIGRLKPGVSVEQAQTQLTAISGGLAQLYPLSNKNKYFQAVQVQEQMVGSVKTTLYLLLGAVGLVLLIACANVANLLLARATSRSREIAVRAALGAGRWRIARQLIVESAVIAVAAALAGMLLASWGVPALLALAPRNLPRLADVHIDGWVLAFTLALSLAASLVFGVAPALQASRIDLNDALKQGAARGTVGGAAGRLRSVLVVAEIAISIVLLVGAGLLIRSFGALTRVEWGFNPDRVLVMQANLASSNLEQAKRVTVVYGEILRQIQAVPGVVTAAGARGLPGSGGRSNGGYYIEGGPGWEQLGMKSPQADFIVNTPGYFQAMQIPFVAGRDFSERDQFDSEFAAIVSESLARLSFPNQDPIGRRIQTGLDTPQFMSIVGVVRDVRMSDPAAPLRPAIYMPYLQHPNYGRNISFVMKTQVSPMALAEALRVKVRGVNSEIPVKFTTMDARLAETVASPRFRGILLGIFAALAVGLAMAGVYGVMAYLVTQRASEIGLRMALGADRAGIVRLVLARGAALTGAGLAAGLLGALAATRLLQNMLFGVAPTDPLTYGTMALGVALVALLACAVPAWRATTVDPLTALRQD
ncbi:MAG TPA: ABC transporter permease [Candidatus Acidoferrales bacterium]|jgi:putative ABC transport system permease protein|nr:ABC transporter permease [Candidatus Acidoferrales bacterium]